MSDDSAGFTVSLTSWRISDNDVETSADPDGEKYIIVEYPLSDNPDEKHVHAIPVSGIAYRMEILGMSDPVEVLDMTIKEMNVPEEEDPSGLYRKALSTYYRTSTEIAKAMASHPRVSALADEGDFLSQVRELLRGGDNRNAVKVMGEDEVSVLVSVLEDVRAEASGFIRSSQEKIVIEENDPVKELRSALIEMSGEVNRMADNHAYMAMATGASYYARMISAGEGE